MIIGKSPGRAGIIGNPTDGYGGAMIACSIPYQATAILTPSSKLELKMGSKKTTIDWKNDLKLQDDCFDLARAVLRYFSPVDLKARIEMKSDIPRQAGMAGSTALLSAILSVILEAIDKNYSRYYFAELNRVIELRYMKTHCGYQDAYMTTFGGLNFLDFRGKEYYKKLKNEYYAAVEPLEAPQLPFMLAHTGIKHHSGDYHKPIRERWLEGEKEVRKGYKEITNIAIRGKRALIEGNWEELGILMNENHQIQDSLSYSGEENNKLIETALDNGALGAKLAGAGGGGTIIVLTLNQEKTRKALLAQGADQIIGLDPDACGITVSKVDEKVRKETAVGEENS
ncbi:MAG: hypothetical protein ACOC4G_06060 [Bacillota bacterium]